MEALLLGSGMQGRAALHDLATRGSCEVVAADRDIDTLRVLVKEKGYKNVRCESLDARDPASIDALMAGVDVAIDLLPVDFIGTVARSAAKHGVHLVNTFYVTPELAAFADEAAAVGMTILPEFGLDPGIDLVLFGEAMRRLDTVTEVRSYGAGIPEPASADNPLKYKVTWTFDGVLKSYRRAARLVRGGEVVEISDREQFAPENVHTIDVEGLGTLEAWPNGDALQYKDFLPRGSHVTHMGRYAGRYPGHAAFWKKLVDLGLLDEEPVTVDGAEVSPKRFLSMLLEPQLQYREGERDVAFLRVDVRGNSGGRGRRIVFEMIDRKDLETGFTAMSRTVGFTASIGAQMIMSGDISRRGLISPVTDVPWEPFKRELEKRGIVISERED